MKQTRIALSALTLGATLLALPVGRIAAQVDPSAKIVAAKSAADQEEIAAELEQEAKELDARAAVHAEMARHYSMHYGRPTLKKHCEELSASLKKAAELAREMAKVHHELAQSAGK